MLKRLRTLLGLCNHEWEDSEQKYKVADHVDRERIVGMVYEHPTHRDYILRNMLTPSDVPGNLKQMKTISCKHCGRMKKYTF